MRAKLVIIVPLSFLACAVANLDLSGHACPCIEGWECDVVRDTCVPLGAAGSAPAPDASNDAPADGAGDAASDGGILLKRVYVLGGRTNSSAATQDMLVSTIGEDGGLSPWSAVRQLLPIGLTYFAIPDGAGLFVTGGGASGAVGQAYFFAVRPDDLNPGAAQTSSLESGPLWHHAAVVANGSLYLVGGRAPAPTGNVIVAPFSGGFVGDQTTTTSLPDARTDHCAFSAAGFLFVAGGTAQRDAAADPSPDVLRARVLSDGGLGPWQSLAPLPLGKSLHDCIVRDGRVYVIGGRGKNVVYVSTIAADGSLSPWAQAGPMPAVGGATLPSLICSAAVTVYGNTMVLAGGILDNITLLDEVFTSVIEADGGLSNWAPAARLPEPRGASGAVAVP